MPSSHQPLVIIGSGPAALTAAIYAARAGHTPVVYTGTAQPGGDLTTTTSVDNFPGFPEGVQGPDLVAQMQMQAERFGARVEWADVTAINVAGQTLWLDDADNAVTYDAVIFATGSEHRKLGLPSEAALSGRGVSYCATCDAMWFQDQRTAVVGGGDSAMEEALFLAKFATTVTILVRGTALRATQAMQDRVASTPNITIRYEHTPLELKEQDGALSGVVCATPDGHIHTLEVTGLFVAIGSTPRTALVEGQVAVTEDGTIAVRGRSSKVSDAHHIAPGFFAAGDVIDPTYRQAITAAASGAVAGMDAAHYLDELATVAD
jgi:thioredoxin reductase (NADPH)